MKTGRFSGKYPGYLAGLRVKPSGNAGMLLVSRFLAFGLVFAFGASLYARGAENDFDSFFSDDRIIAEEFIAITEAFYGRVGIRVVNRTFEGGLPSGFEKMVAKNLVYSGLFDLEPGGENAELFLTFSSSLFGGVNATLSSEARVVLRKNLELGENAVENELAFLEVLDAMSEALTGNKTSLGKPLLSVEKKKSGGTRIVLSDPNGLRKKILVDDESLNFLPKFSPSGERFFYTKISRGRSRIVLQNFADGSEKIIASYKGLSTGGDWMDEKNILTTISRRGNSDIYQIDDRGKVKSKLTRRGSIESSPSFSDGGLMAYISDRSGSVQIYQMNLGTRRSKRLTFFSNYNSEPAYSRDENYILFSANTGGGVFQIFVMNADGGRVRQVTRSKGSAEQPAWSFDDRLIAFTEEIRGFKSTYLMTVDGEYRRLVSPFVEGSSNSQADWAENFDWSKVRLSDQP